MDGRPFGEAADELVEEFFSTDLKVEGVPAILDADIQKLF